MRVPGKHMRLRRCCRGQRLASHSPALRRRCRGLLRRQLKVPTLDGPSELTVPACTMNGDVLVMRGKGVADPRGRGRGDQLVSIR